MLHRDFLKFRGIFCTLNKPPSIHPLPVHPVPFPHPPDRAKTYNRLRLLLGLCSSALTFLLLVALVALHWSTVLADWARSVVPGTYGALLAFVCATALLQAAITLPLGFILGYSVEHRYGLSNQSLGRWAWERLKGILVSAPLAGALIIALYASMELCGDFWWAALGLLLVLVNVLLARIAPVFLFPIFYKVAPLENGPLKERIVALCANAGFRYEGIFSFNLSKNTRKANAAFTGIGKAKRILLGDTLLKDFTDEEIETIVAHELGHYVRHHLLIGIVVGTAATFAGLFVAARLYSASLTIAGFTGPTDLAALPLLAIWLSLFALATMPLGNMLSRRHEREADTFAVQTTGNAPGFASALRKLAARNLADPNPHPLIEFLFYSHPSIGRRLRMVEGAAGL
jgi:STE24 endopeptidase